MSENKAKPPCEFPDCKIHPAGGPKKPSQNDSSKRLIKTTQNDSLNLICNFEIAIGGPADKNSKCARPAGHWGGHKSTAGIWEKFPHERKAK